MHEKGFHAQVEKYLTLYFSLREACISTEKLWKDQQFRKEDLKTEQFQNSVDTGTLLAALIINNHSS